MSRTTTGSSHESIATSRLVHGLELQAKRSFLPSATVFGSS